MWRGRLIEVDRLEWRVADGADPARLVEDYLTAAGLPAVDLTASTPTYGKVVGAGLLVGAAAAARLAGLDVGPPTPVPAVPDLAVVLYALGEPPRRSPGPPARIGTWTSEWTDGEHAAAIELVRDAIARGDVYQANVVRHHRASYEGDLSGGLAAVAALPGAAYGGLLNGADWAVTCGSPEALVSVRDGEIRTVPIKGTAPITGPDDHGEVLRGSGKDRAEHIMIVDLERNDLSRVAEIGSVRVESLYALERWAGLWQASSVVRARLRAGVGLAEVLRAVLPGGSVTGAPKRAAVSLLAGLEPVGRGPAMGAFGFYSPAFGLDLGLTIRTVAADSSSLHVWAGGGITWSSDPVAEVAEAAAKAAPVRAALAGAGPAG